MTHEMQPETMEFSRAVDTPPVPTSPTDGSAAAAPPGRSRLAVAMLVVAGLLLIAAVVFGVLGFQAQSKASDERDQAAVAARHRHALAVSERGYDDDRDQLEEDVFALPKEYEAVGTSLGDMVDAHNHYIDVATNAAELYNSGDTGGAVAVLQGDGTTAIDDLNAKRTATQQAVQHAEDALRELQEGL